MNIHRIQMQHRLASNKLCQGCGDVKPLTAFYQKSRYFRGSKRTRVYSTQCRECERAMARERLRLTVATTRPMMTGM